MRLEDAEAGVGAGLREASRQGSEPHPHLAQEVERPGSHPYLAEQNPQSRQQPFMHHQQDRPQVIIPPSPPPSRPPSPPAKWQSQVWGGDFLGF